MKLSNKEQVIGIIKEKGIIRSRDITALGIRREILTTLYKQGLINRAGRGIYVSLDMDITQHHSLAEVSKRVPKGVICLFSALSFYELTTQNSSKVWIAVDRKDWLPDLDIPYVNIVRFSGNALNYGIEEHIIEGVEVRIYNPAKTVADCFKYRNKIGLDVALEALRDCWNKKKATMDELWEAAEICRVARVMRPYMEALV